MIPSRQEIFFRFYGAWRLARFDASGAQYFDASRGAALRSFFAAILVAPAFFISLLIRGGDFSGIEPFLVLLVFALIYCLDWTAFPVIAHRVCQTIDRERAFFKMLSALNWSNLISVHLQLAVLVLVVGGVVPEALASLVNLVLYAYLLSYLWFIVRHCLEVSALAAVGFVALRFLIDLFLALGATGVLL